MYKELKFQTQDHRGVFLYTIGEGRDAEYLTKTASTSFHPQIADYIANAKPIEGKTQVLLTSLGAGEYWGSNVNGDYFPQDGLRHHGPDYGHKTFETLGKVYKHHINKDPQKSYGDVLLSVWHDTMKRVELIVTLDHEKAPDLIERINNAEYPSVSMGCRVKFDVCSVCGNKAKTRAQYCDHLRYHMNKIPPGFDKKAYAINLKPKFFDISFVLVGADRIAKVMKKIAHVDKLAFGLSTPKIAERKQAEIKKIVPSNTEPNTVKNLEEIGDRDSKLLQAYEKPIPKNIIIKITSTSAPGPAFLSRVLSSLSATGILPKPPEFQSIALRSLGQSGLADKLEGSQCVFNPYENIPQRTLSRYSDQLDIDPEKTDNDIIRSLIPILPEKSYARPHLSKRVIRIVKLAGANQAPEESKEKVIDSSFLPVMGVLTALYAAYGNKSADAIGKVEKLVTKNPLLAAALGAGMVGLTAGAVSAMEPTKKGKYDFNPDKGPSKSLSWDQRISHFNQNPLTKTSSFTKTLKKNFKSFFPKAQGVAKTTVSPKKNDSLIPLSAKIFAGVPFLYFASGAKRIDKMRNPHEEEGFISKTVRKNPMALSGLLVGSHFLKKPNLKSLPKYFSKTGELADDMKSHMLYTLAFPGKSLVSRSASMLADAGIMSAMQKAFTRSPKPKPVGGIKHDNLK